MNPKKSLNKKLAECGTAIIAVLLCLIAARFFSTDIVQKKETIAYPLEDYVDNYDPYVQQFDAFMKGQANIDVEADPALEELENVYNYKERTVSGIYYLWDRAYYDGKYYSYFGITPIITVMMPYYLLHGCLPGSGTVMTVFVTMAAIFMPLAACLWIHKFSPKTPHWVSVFAGPALFYGSLILLIARGRTPFYFEAFVAALAFFSAFVFFALAAFTSENKVMRCIFWALCGVSYAFLFHARVLTAVAAAFLVIPGLWFFIIGRKRNEKGLNRLAPILSELLCLGLPVIIAIGGAMYFNAIRFSGPLDFGSNYNLTVADVSTYKFDVEDIQYALFHYLNEAPAKSEAYPYVTFSYVKFTNYGHYVYNDANFGLFPASPLCAFILLAPAVFFSPKFSKSRKFFSLAAFFCIPCILLTDFCLGGVIYRYLGDFSFVAALFAIVTLVSVCEIFTDCLDSRAKSDTQKVIVRTTEYVLYGALCLLFVFTIVSALRIALINDNGNIMAYGEEAAQKVQELLPFSPVEAAQ